MPFSEAMQNVMKSNLQLYLVHGELWHVQGRPLLTPCAAPEAAALHFSLVKA